eukprot:Skav212402  [mRNA]  locus=scaffold469:92646:96586:- [translate_table: standard]
MTSLKAKTEAGKDVDFQKTMVDAVADVFTAAVFGKSIGMSEGSVSEEHQAWVDGAMRTAEKTKKTCQTRAQILHAAAWLDFKTHIGELLQAGKLREAFVCGLSQFQDIQKRLRLSKTCVEKAAEARHIAAILPGPVMPNELGGKVLTVTLKNGNPLCPLLQDGTCPNEASKCQHGAHLCAILQHSGCACGLPRQKKFSKADIPLLVVAKRSAALVPCPAPRPPPARGTSTSKKPSQRCWMSGRWPGRAVKPSLRFHRRRRLCSWHRRRRCFVPLRLLAIPLLELLAEALDARLEYLGMGGGRGGKTAQAPTMVWVQGGKFGWCSYKGHRAAFPCSGAPGCCFPDGPESRGGVTFQGVQIMTFAAAYAAQRTEQWRPLLAGETIEDAKRRVESLRDTELRKVTKSRSVVWPSGCARRGERETNALIRGAASKLYGVASFLEQGIYGRVGYGGLMAIKDRQTEDAKHLAAELLKCFKVIEAVARFEPRRDFAVLPCRVAENTPGLWWLSLDLLPTRWLSSASKFCCCKLC